MIGQTLAHYQITGQLGHGGMGEVYRARDTKLGREVAVKVLPQEFTADETRRRRFEQEARTLAALDHPNILVIHDTGIHDGAPYLVSELLDGHTLRQVMKEGTLPPRKVTEYGLQIAQGLAAAHGKGIVHRDLKPENLFVTKDGRVKILDLGLARLRQPEGEPPGEPKSEPGTSGAPPRQGINDDASTVAQTTEPGTVLGTPSYMSPEQVRGEAVDHRSDIFAFGAILYEMLGGQRAFRGNTTIETMNAILTEEPPDLSETNANISSAMERVVRRCLEKQPDNRFQSAKDLAFALETLSGSTATRRGEVAGARAAARLRWRQWAVAAALVLVLASATFYSLGRKLAARPHPSYRQLTTRRGIIHNARFAPDGRAIIYSARRGGQALEIFATRSDLPESRSLGLTNADVLSVSSKGEMAVLLNGQHLGWFIHRGILARLPVAGGAPRELVQDAQEADWSPDGSELAVVRYVEGRNRLEYPVGQTLYETTGWISHPRVSPKGDAVALLDHPGQWDNRGWVVVVDRAGKKRTLSVEWAGLEGLAWSAQENEIWFTGNRAGEAWAIHATSLAGKQRLIARAPTDLFLQDIGRDGRALVVCGNEVTDVLGLVPGENKERDFSPLPLGTLEGLAADGRTFLFTYQGQASGPNYTAYLGKTDGSPPVRLGEGRPTGLSPDGRWVATVLPSTGEIVLLPTGAGEPKRLERHGIFCFEALFFPDGKRVAILGQELGKARRHYVQARAAGPPRAISPEGAGSTGLLIYISVDGKYVLGRDAQGAAHLYPVDGGEQLPVPEIAEQDRIAGWSSDGQSVFVFRAVDFPIRLERLILKTGQREPFKDLSPADLSGVIHGSKNIHVTPDGKGYAYEVQRLVSELYLAEGWK